MMMFKSMAGNGAGHRARDGRAPTSGAERRRPIAVQRFSWRPFAAVSLTMVLLGPALVMITEPAAADPVGSTQLTASGTETTTTSDTESVATWNYDMTWIAASDLPGLVGTTLATATGTISYDIVTTSHHVWFPPPDFGPDQVTCRTQTTTTWSGTVEPSPDLFFSPEIRVDPAATDGLYNVSSRVWIEGQAAQRHQLSFSGSPFNPFCNASFDETNPSNFHLDGRVLDVALAPTMPPSLSGASAIGEADWSGFIDPGGPATFAFNLSPGTGGRLEVVPAADNDLGDDASFTYTGAVTGSTTVGVPLVSSVAAGTHTVSQSPHDQFVLSAINCDGPHEVNLVNGSVTVDVDSGQTVRCTFHNAALIASVGYDFDVEAVKKPPQATATGFNFVHIDAPASIASELRICAYDSWRIDVKKPLQTDLITFNSLPSDDQYYDFAFGTPVPWRSATLDRPSPTSCADGADLVYGGTMEAAALNNQVQVLAVWHGARVEILRDGVLWSSFEVPADDFTPKNKNVALGDLDCQENFIRLPAHRAVACEAD